MTDLKQFHFLVHNFVLPFHCVYTIIDICKKCNKFETDKKLISGKNVTLSTDLREKLHLILEIVNKIANILIIIYIIPSQNHLASPIIFYLIILN